MPFSDQAPSLSEDDKAPPCTLIYTHPAGTPHAAEHPRKPIEDGPDVFRHRIRSGGYKAVGLG